MALATGWSSPDWSGRASQKRALVRFVEAVSRLAIRALNNGQVGPIY
jgi:hypothetical protein